MTSLRSFEKELQLEHPPKSFLAIEDIEAVYNDKKDRDEEENNGNIIMMVQHSTTTSYAHNKML